MNPPSDLGACLDCDAPATTTRPVVVPWLTADGVVVDGNEWCCDLHRAGA